MGYINPWKFPENWHWWVLAIQKAEKQRKIKRFKKKNLYKKIVKEACIYFRYN